MSDQPPTGGYDNTVCQNCGLPVTPQFRRVFGDNENRVWACLQCTTAAAIHAGAAHMADDSF